MNVDAIVPLMPLTSRKARRIFVQEAEKVIEPLEEVNASFLFELFDESNKSSYIDLYRKYHESWTRRVKNLCRSKEFTHIAIDATWFTNQYKPEV